MSCVTSCGRSESPACQSAPLVPEGSGRRPPDAPPVYLFTRALCPCCSPHVEVASYTREHPTSNEVVIRCQTSGAISAEQGVVEALVMAKQMLEHVGVSHQALWDTVPVDACTGPNLACILAPAPPFPIAHALNVGFVGVMFAGDHDCSGAGL